MSATYKVEGFDDFFDEVANMEISTTKKRRVLNEVGDVFVKGIEPYLPKRSGRYRRMLAKHIKQLDEGLSVVVNSKAYYDVFDEFGTSQSKKSVGSFERGVNAVADKAVETAMKGLIK